MGWAADAAAALGSAAAQGAAAAGSAIGSAAASAGSAIGGVAGGAVQTIGEAAASAGSAIGNAANGTAQAAAGTAQAGAGAAQTAGKGAGTLADAANQASTAAAENPLAKLSWEKVKQGALETGDKLLNLTSEGKAVSTMLHGGFSPQSMLDAAQGYAKGLLGQGQGQGADQPPAAASILAALMTGSSGKPRREEPQPTQAPQTPVQAQGSEGQATQQQRPQSRNYGQFGAAPQVQGQKPFDWIDYYNSLWR